MSAIAVVCFVSSLPLVITEYLSIKKSTYVHVKEWFHGTNAVKTSGMKNRLPLRQLIQVSPTGDNRSNENPVLLAPKHSFQIARL
jgi:hypothetical protein